MRMECGRNCCAVCKRAVVPGQVSCWMGSCWEHGAGTPETAGGKEAGSYFRTKSHTTVDQFLLLTSGDLRPYGARHTQHYFSYSPATLCSALCDNQVFPPSGLSHTVAGTHRHSWEPPPRMGTLGIGKKFIFPSGEEGKKICPCSDLQSLKLGRTRVRRWRQLVQRSSLNLSLQPQTRVTSAYCRCRNTTRQLEWMLPHCTKAIRE